ncbi:Leu/Phe/Val dehydrogenase [Spongorhabdus nitratireducens]
MFSRMKEAQINDIHFRHDKPTGLKAMIAIHSTRRGPALGGCRCIPYDHTEDALADAIDLARGMSYKAALAGLDLGGGKAVIMEPAEAYDREALFKAFGRFVEELGGRYITAMDSGTMLQDMDWISTETRHVTCTSHSGDPSPYTARGVFAAIKACLQASDALPDTLQGLRVAVQGAGNVGFELCRLLHEAGAQLQVADIDEERRQCCIDAFGANTVPVDQILTTECDILSPCGLGHILTEELIPKLRCSAIAGSANNQLAGPEVGLALYRQGILYAPDYLINAGGLIFVAMSHEGQSEADIYHRVDELGDTLLKLFHRQEQSGEASSLIADRMAEQILYGNNDEAVAS